MRMEEGHKVTNTAIEYTCQFNYNAVGTTSIRTVSIVLLERLIEITSSNFWNG